METPDILASTFALNALWQVPAVVAAGLLGERLLGRAAARWHHRLWLSALGLCLLLPLASLLPERSGKPGTGPERARSRLQAAAANGEGESWLEWMARQRPEASLPPSLKLGLLVWLGVASLVALGRLTAATRRTRALARSARPVELPGAVAAAAARWRRAFGLGRVDILASPDLPGPVTLGWWRPRILVPPSFLARTETEIAAALGHEMAHVHRRDYPLHLAGEVLALPLAFHPVLRLVRRRLVLTREMACDEAAVESGIDARAYARSLLALAAAMVALSTPIHTLGVFDANTLEARMKRMVDRRPRPGRWPARLRFAAAGLVLAILGLGASTFAIAGGSSAGYGGKAFVGTWAGWFEAKPGQKVKAIDLTVHEAGEHPELAVTMYRTRFGDDGKAEATPETVTVVSSRFEGGKLAFRTRAENFRYQKDGPFEKVEMDWTVELTGKDTAALRAVWNSKFSPAKERGEDVPPPPPPLPLQRVR